MAYVISIGAAFGCALCNGTAAVLQKVSADKERNVSSLDVGLLWHLARDSPYLLGAALDIIGWGLTLIAVRNLPLFLVESIIAINIVITACIERFLFRRSLGFRSYLSILIIVLGLVLLSIAASPERAEPITSFVRWTMIIIPLPIALAGAILTRLKSNTAVFGIAILSGIAFGQTSVVGRIFQFSHPLWHTIYSPFIWALVANGFLGILLFSISLQRAYATTMTAMMTAAQTLVPTFIGIAFLGDEARHGLWGLVVLGTLLALLGTLAIALESNRLLKPESKS